jgi:hypothetical protein
LATLNGDDKFVGYFTRYDLLDLVEEPLYTNITVDVFPLEFTLAEEKPISEV